eukprot:TRINITY_DN31056_c0_g1_i1.p1 TRINITY_DN31056_c0_g1~~TRINITY_DN31056_c0_g1_i1.p1  ORF type:complete len:270 (+),score=26.18 TRINITY_DN31056_c0_g1_i1:40-849(+)
MVTFSDEYALEEVIGKGAFATVHACTHLKTGHRRAARIVVLQRHKVKRLIEQVQLLKSLCHKNIVQVHSIYLQHGCACIVVDRYVGDVLDGMLTHSRTLGQIGGRTIVHVIFQMSAALHLLHSKGIVHRDIKPDNFLIDVLDITDPNCQVALSDFDSVSALPSSGRLSAWVGTCLYWAPEVFSRNYAVKVDIWALGISIFGLLAGHFPFSGELDIQTKDLIYPKRIDLPLQDLLTNMLCKSEGQRFSADDVIVHSALMPNNLSSDGGWP